MSVDEIRRLLSSEKFNERKKAKNTLRNLIKTDNSLSLMSSSQSWEILRSLIEWEIKELRDDAKKGKGMNFDNVIFCKVVIKYLLAFIPASGNKSQEVIGHSLVILYREEIDNKYKDEHRYILCDILDSDFSHSTLMSTFADIFNYMKGNADLRLRSHTKLLRSFCKALFCDISESGLLTSVFSWFAELIQDSSSESNIQNYTTETIADCYTILMEYHGLNCMKFIFPVSWSPIKAIIKQLSVTQTNNRESYLRFLLRIIASLRRFVNNNQDLSLEMPSMLQILNVLCKNINSDSFIRSVVQHAHNQSSIRTSKDTFVNICEDVKVRLHFELCAASVVLEQKICSFTSMSADKRKSLLCGRCLGEDASESDSHLFLVIQNILDRLVALNCAHDNHTLSQQQSLHNLDSFVSKHTSPPLIEGLLCLLLTIIQRNPSRVLFGFCRIEKIKCTCVVVESIYRIFIAATDTFDVQLHGSAFLVLLVLSSDTTILPMQTCFSAECDAEASAAYRLKRVWSALVSSVLHKEVFQHLFAKCRKGSIGDIVISLLSNLCAAEALDRNRGSDLEKMLWSLPLFSDPRNVECSAVFALMSSLASNRSAVDVPLDLGSRCATLAYMMIVALKYSILLTLFKVFSFFGCERSKWQTAILISFSWKGRQRHFIDSLSYFVVL